MIRKYPLSRVVLFLSTFGVLFPAVLFAQTDNNIVQVNYSYPAPNTTQVSAKTTIGIRYGESVMRSALQSIPFFVIGTSSGLHTGKPILALDGRTVIFTPDKFFSSGEKVVVNIGSVKCLSGKNTAVYSFTFVISKSKILPSSLIVKPFASTAAEIPEQSNDSYLPRITAAGNGADTLPDDFPAIHVTENNNPAPGNIYLDNFKFTRNDSGTYLMIVDNGGNVLFERSTWPAFAQDFKPQRNGLFTYFDADPDKFKFYGLDSNFVRVDSFEAANGYTTDSHELIFLPGGGYALLAQTDEQVDMSHVVSNGDTNTTVVEGVLQEFDKAKNLIFEWRTKDHFAFSDPTHENFLSPFLDFTHCNSIEYDSDSTFLLSSRNLDEITKIDRENGHILWRWGGKNNEFTFVNDSLIFSHQHAVRRLPNRNIIMFDNGTFHNTAMPFSRAVEYRLDEKAKIATQAWEYHHTPEVYGNAMGYVQRLDNGNTLICWGGCDSVAVTEVKPDGSTALEIKFDLGIYSYRAYKYTKDQIKAMRERVPPAPAEPAFILEQNYPNPCTISSIISFTISMHTSVTLKVYDELGREIRTLFDGTVEAGNYSAKFDRGNLRSGMYYYTLRTPSGSLTKMMLLIK